MKVDKGLAQEQDGVQLMKPMPDLDGLLIRAGKRNIFGTKMRSVIKQANPEGVGKIVEQQFALGRQIAAAGLVPIIEPEVDVFSEDKAESEKLLLSALIQQIAALDKEVKIMLKLSIPSVDDFYRELMEDPHIVRIVALSGGYTQSVANEKLARNHGLIASFSRALAQGLTAGQTQEEFDAMLSQSIQSIYEASLT